MLVHSRVTPGIAHAYADTHLTTLVERSTVRVKWLTQDLNAMSPARAWTRNTRPSVERSNQEGLPALLGLSILVRKTLVSVRHRSKSSNKRRGANVGNWKSAALTLFDPQLPQPRQAQQIGVGCVCKKIALIRGYTIVVSVRVQRRDENLIHPFPVMRDFVHLANDNKNPVKCLNNVKCF